VFSFTDSFAPSLLTSYVIEEIALPHFITTQATWWAAIKKLNAWFEVELYL
jgi:hypothetical protein